MVFRLLISVFLFCVVYLLSAQDYYNISSGSSQIIDKHGTCKNVQNSASDAVFVPVKTQSEWLSFVNNPPAGISLSDCDGLINIYQYYSSTRKDHWYTTSSSAPTAQGVTYAPGAINAPEETVAFMAHSVQVPGSIPIYNVVRYANGSCGYCPSFDHYLTKGTSDPTCGNNTGCPYVGWASNNAYPSYTNADIAFYAYSSAVTVNGVTAVPVKSFWKSQSSGMDHYFQLGSSCSGPSGYSCESIRFYAFPGF
tara:strand:+ start:1747 stop:2502 length:756 start_codon:yes stop_codon:yes gene_type:complete